MLTCTHLSRKLGNDGESTFFCSNVVVVVSFDAALTFGDERVPVGAGQGAVDLADQLHVVEEGVEGVEVGEAHHVGGAASRRLQNRGNKVCHTFCTEAQF